MQSGISIPELEGARPGLTIVIAGVDPVLIPGLNGVSALDSGLTGVGDRRNRTESRVIAVIGNPKAE